MRAQTGAGVVSAPEESGPVLGWSSAIASYGAFIIPVMFGIALKAGNPEITFYGLGGYYISCGLLNFYYYLRPGWFRASTDAVCWLQLRGGKYSDWEVHNVCAAHDDDCAVLPRRD